MSAIPNQLCCLAAICHDFTVLLILFFRVIFLIIHAEVIIDNLDVKRLL